MASKARLVVFQLFLFFLAIWLGSAFHDTISTNIAWFKNPLLHINHVVNHPVPGEINTWIISTALLTLMTIATFLSFIGYKGNSKREALVAVAGTLVLLLTTFLYFVPTLVKIFEKTSAFNKDALISMSQQWVVFNFIRLFLLMGFFLMGLKALVKLANRQVETLSYFSKRNI